MPPLNLPPTYKDYERGRVLVAFNSTWESQQTVPSVAEPEPSLLVEPAWSEAVWKSKFHGAFVLDRRLDLHAIDATPARRRAPDARVDFHTGRNEAKGVDFPQPR